MTMFYPIMIVVAVVVTGAAVTAYVMVVRRRSAALRATNFSLTARSSQVRRHLPYALFLAALPLLLIAIARPQANLKLPHIAGTVVLAFDVSNSMGANDVKPSRLAAAQQVANSFVEAQPDTVDIGVVIFGQDGLAIQQPTNDHSAVQAAIHRMDVSGGTSLTQAILAALTAITGKSVHLPDDSGPGPGDSGQAPSDQGQDQPAQDLGYWGSATIVLLSDGQDSAPDRAQAAAELASNAGVRIETVGIGTAKGTTVKVDGYQVATALNEELLTQIATTTGGAYHPAGDAAAINQIHKSIDLRLTTKAQPVEVTALFALAGLLLLVAGGLLMIRWHGRIV
jgi:Ca-activated chloride channel homolog